ncbi:hypothetical protein GBF38_015664, partial [Nibea albiflora]
HGGETIEATKRWRSVTGDNMADSVEEDLQHLEITSKFTLTKFSRVKMKTVSVRVK